MASLSGPSKNRMHPFACATLIAVAAALFGSHAVARPATPAGQAHAAPEIVHVVQPGQYLSIIAKRYHTTSEAIRKTNGLNPGTTLKPGASLRIAETPEHAAWREKNEPHLKKDEPIRTREHDQDHGRAHDRDHDDAAKNRDKGREKGRERGGDDEPSTPHRGAADGAVPSTPNADKWAKRPARPGFVTATRFTDTFRGSLRASNGNVVAKAAEKFDWLLRSSKTQEQMKMDRRLLKLLSQVSDHFGGREVVLVSGFRPFSSKQFTKNSRHNHGEAIDFRIAGVPNIALYEYCLTLPQVGCGYYPNSLFIHLDVRLLKTRWVDYSRPGEAPKYARTKPVIPNGGGHVGSHVHDEDDDDDPEPDDD